MSEAHGQIGLRVSKKLFFNNTTIYSTCSQASDLRYQFELTSDLKSSLQITINQCRKWHAFNTGKSLTTSLDHSNKSDPFEIWFCS